MSIAWAWAAMVITLAPSLAAATLADPAPPTPLKPTGQWLIEGQNNMCALSHDYGEGRTRVTLGIRPYPIAEVNDVLLFTRTNGDDVRDGKATVQIDNGAASQPANYISYALTQHEQRLLSFRVPAGSLSDLATSTKLTLLLDHRKQVVISTKGFDHGLAALAQCQKLLRAQLGIDMNEQARVTMPARPKGAPALWFSERDYPSEALHSGAQGISRLLLTIGVDGRISRCVAFGTSGNADMDKTACRKFVERGRYTPAMDAAGKPMTYFDETSVHWKQ